MRCLLSPPSTAAGSHFPVSLDNACREIAFLICDDRQIPILPLPPFLKTHPDPEERYCAGMKKGECSWHRGRAVGGTTNINGMFYVRGECYCTVLYSSFGQTYRQMTQTDDSTDSSAKRERKWQLQLRGLQFTTSHRGGRGGWLKN